MNLLVEKISVKKRVEERQRFFLVIFFFFRSLIRGSFYLKKRGSKEIDKKGFSRGVSVLREEEEGPLSWGCSGSVARGPACLASVCPPCKPPFEPRWYTLL